MPNYTKTQKKEAYEYLKQLVIKAFVSDKEVKIGDYLIMPVQIR